MTNERHGDEDVRRLIEAAGPRTEVPPEDLDAITAAARAAWRRKVEEASGTVPDDHSVAAFGAAARAPRPAAPEVTEEVAGGPRRLDWRVLGGMAAMLVMALGFVWWWGGAVDPSAPAAARLAAATGEVRILVDGGPIAAAAGEPVPAGSTVVTGAGARAALVLEGGTEIRLDADTRLVVASAAALALSRGAVYADTGDAAAAAADGARIAVATPLGTARDIGTRFAVRLLADPEPLLAVRVRDGAVEVEQAERSFRAAAGEALLLDAAGRAERRSIAAHGEDWEWVLAAAAGFEVEGRTLPELLAWVERETGWRVRYATPELETAAADIVLHGDLGDLPPDQAPFAVLPGAGLEGRLEAGTLIVARP